MGFTYYDSISHSAIVRGKSNDRIRRRMQSIANAKLRATPKPLTKSQWTYQEQSESRNMDLNKAKKLNDHYKKSGVAPKYVIGLKRTNGSANEQLKEHLQSNERTRSGAPSSRDKLRVTINKKRKQTR